MIVAGFGFRGAATQASLAAALQSAGQTPDCLAAPADKCTCDAMQGLAQTLGLRLVPVKNIEGVETPTRSSASLMARGTGSVAEAAALAAAGPDARLIRPRVISPDRMATCALAEGTGP